VPPKGRRYCRACHAAYTREWRKKNPEKLTPEQRIKVNARRAANKAVKDYRLFQEPCAMCGDPNTEKHHPDYSRPLLVIWLCHQCHVDLHMSEKSSSTDGGL
jgi:hypothetical protein